MQHRNFKLINTSEQQLINQSMSTAISRWQSTWARDDAMSLSYEVFTTDEVTEALASCKTDWLVGQVDNGSRVGMAWSEHFPQKIHDIFVQMNTAYKNGSGIQSYVSKRLLNKSLTSMLEIIIDTFTRHKPVITAINDRQTDFSSLLTRPGNGYVVVCVSFEDEYIIAAIDTNIILPEQTYNIAGDELSPAINAFGENKVTVTAVLGEAELDLDSLVNLGVDDVLTLDKSLQDKVTLFIDNKQIADGYLGKQNNAISVQIDNSTVN